MPFFVVCLGERTCVWDVCVMSLRAAAAAASPGALQHKHTWMQKPPGVGVQPAVPQGVLPGAQTRGTTAAAEQEAARSADATSTASSVLRSAIALSHHRSRL